MSPGSACMAVLAWFGRVRAVVAGWAAGLGCCGMVVVVGAGGVPRGSGCRVVRCGWTRPLVGVSRPAGGRAGGPPDLSWSSWPGACQGRVSPPVPVGATKSRRASGAPLGARLEASDVRALVREAHPRGGGLVGGGQVGVRKGRPGLRGPQLRGVGMVCRVEECAEWLRCSFPSAEGGVGPATSDSEVGCYLIWCGVRPRFWRRGCCLGGRELWVWEV